MSEADRGGVEVELGGLGAAVLRIADDREAGRRQVRAHLMRAPGAEVHAEERPVPAPLEHLPGGARGVGTAPAADTDPVAAAPDAPDRLVRDTGRGMAEDVLARIGTPFFTTREEGTGLGVALARATMVRHGGTLEYESRPGEGTVATVTLPAAARRTDGARARGG